MANMSEHDWNMINNILLDVYSLDDIKDIGTTFLNSIRVLIPYSQAYFIIFDENKDIDSEKSCFHNVSEENIYKYINYFYSVDYVSYIFNFTHPITIRDTDIMEDHLREKTEFYQGFLLPQNMHYGGGILFAKENRLLGLFNLFRCQDIGDITQREQSILEVIKDHLNNILFSISINSKANDGRKNLNVNDLSRFNLSKRENELIELLIKGHTNSEISESLSISTSTVKKHVYNIFTKIGVNSRMQLIKFIEKNEV